MKPNQNLNYQSTSMCTITTQASYIKWVGENDSELINEIKDDDKTENIVENKQFNDQNRKNKNHENKIDAVAVESATLGIVIAEEAKQIFRKLHDVIPSNDIMRGWVAKPAPLRDPQHHHCMDKGVLPHWSME